MTTKMNDEVAKAVRRVQSVEQHDLFTLNMNLHFFVCLGFSCLFPCFFFNLKELQRSNTYSYGLKPQNTGSFSRKNCQK